jgi:hypothetical protein
MHYFLCGCLRMETAVGMYRFVYSDCIESHSRHYTERTEGLLAQQWLCELNSVLIYG